jgi:hypothetical protein
MEWIGLEANLALLEGWVGGNAAGGFGGLPSSPDPPLPPGTNVASIPVLNPDGFARVEEAVGGGRPRWIRGTTVRVDLNRNFPSGWRARPRWLGFWPLYRPGPSPLSEPEAAALARAERSVRPAVSLSLHSFGRRVFYPPSSRWRPWPGTARHARVAARALAETGAQYRHGQLGRWSPLFRARGTEIDYLHERGGGLAYLVEISRGGFGLWGASRCRDPFCLFNPPRPERELSLVLPLLRRLCVFGLGSGEPVRQPFPYGRADG